ncbi:hypothetical protein [Thalassospira sp. MCCC 1A01428]|jgi:LmbE family N-acetylglucosaminyl deacetylase|uniref:hypothetical protein n=1 Tax=unclassified Thalassospira TaxID=2648997 RepID=UPI000A1E5003|nr:hypothetical protein [Thalassospira sp. MCCC 1A01428]OSQ44811.1 hypothetical protein THS27_06615 [Thalassospira sp. MCCC 1A01428]
MPVQKANPKKLNALQARTLALAQILAKDPNSGVIDAETGEGTITRAPHGHGDHVHVGEFVVAARDASGFSNPSVWVALARKGLVHEGYPQTVVLTAEGMTYDTGLAEHFVNTSDH